MKKIVSFSCLIFLMGNALAYSEDYAYPDYQTQQQADYSSYSDASSYEGDAVGSSETSVWPSRSVVDVLCSMNYRDGDGHATMTNWMTVFNLVQMSKGRWGFSASGAFRMTWIDGTKEANFGLDRLFTIWTDMNVSYRLFGSTKLVMGATPQWSSDFDSWVADNFFLGGHVMLSGKWNESVSYIAGVAYAPQFGDSPWIPYFGFTWKINDRWQLDMTAPRLSLINKVSEGFSWGPFCGVVSGVWTVKNNRRHERFEWRSAVIGISTESGLGRWGKLHPKLIADVGMTCWNRARFKSSDGDTELESFRFDPGFYVRAGIQWGF